MHLKILCVLLMLPGFVGGCAMAEYSGTRAAMGESAPALAAQSDSTPAGKPLAAPAAATPAPHAPALDRLIIYNAGLRLVVADIARSLDAVRDAATAAGGYLQEQQAAAIIVRVPAPRFHQTISTIEKLGEVTERHVKAQDITEEMRDLNIRLQTAEQTRQRLLEHLKHSAKMEDTLKLEAELDRVTQTIELIKGKIRFLESQVAFSTIAVQFNSPLPQKQMVTQLPFAWIRQLGDGLVAGTAQGQPDTSRWRCRVVSLDLPPGFVKYYERDDLAEAMNADGVLVKLLRHENYQGGDVTFWGKLARRALVENRSLCITRESDVALRSKAKARLIVGTRDLGGKQNGYLLALVPTERRIYTLEAWGPAAEFARELANLEAMVQSVEP
jgi:hypothetical protein